MFNPMPKDKDKPKPTETIPDVTCLECGKTFTPRNKYVRLKFCSRLCAITDQWKKRERKPKKAVIKNCLQCGAEYAKIGYSKTQLSTSKFCSLKCSSESQRIKDGMNTQERGRRKRGQLKTGTQAWIEKIKARTKEGMMRPDVLEKLRQPKGPLSTSVKMKISDALAGVMPKNMISGGAGYSNIQRGTYECSKGSVYFRSKWEANYALYLDFLIKQNEISAWEFEADMFFFEKIKLGTRSYTPDFKVFNLDDTIEYHEVKGYMDSKSKTKLRRMDMYFPEVKLILIERTFYTSLLKQLKCIIKFY